MQAKERLRAFLRPLRRRIRGGPNAGLRWSLPTRLKFLRGDYEPALAGFLAAHLPADACFWDVGAHLGYHTLIAARRARTVLAFEPDRWNRPFLEAHVRWNDLANVTVHACALSATSGRAAFGAGRGPGSRRLGAGRQTVDVTTVDALVAAGAPAPDWIKIDVQGAEADVLDGAAATLRGRAATVLCGAHSPALHERCTGLLADWGYTVRDAPAKKVTLGFGPGAPLPDVDPAAFEM